MSRLKTKLDSLSQPIKFKKNRNQPMSAKQAYRVTPWRYMIGQSYDASESISRKWQSFLKNCQIFLWILARLNRITKAEGILCYKKRNMKGREVILWTNDTLKSTKTWLKVLDEWRGLRCETRNLNISGPETSSYIKKFLWQKIGLGLRPSPIYSEFFHPSISKLESM